MRRRAAGCRAPVAQVGAAGLTSHSVFAPRCAGRDAAPPSPQHLGGLSRGALVQAGTSTRGPRPAAPRPSPAPPAPLNSPSPRRCPAVLHSHLIPAAAIAALCCGTNSPPSPNTTLPCHERLPLLSISPLPACRLVPPCPFHATTMSWCDVSGCLPSLLPPLERACRLFVPPRQRLFSTGPGALPPSVFPDPCPPLFHPKPPAQTLVCMHIMKECLRPWPLRNAGPLCHWPPLLAAANFGPVLSQSIPQHLRFSTKHWLCLFPGVTGMLSLRETRQRAGPSWAGCVVQRTARSFSFSTPSPTTLGSLQAFGDDIVVVVDTRRERCCLGSEGAPRRRIKTHGREGANGLVFRGGKKLRDGRR